MPTDTADPASSSQSRQPRLPTFPRHRRRRRQNPPLAAAAACTTPTKNNAYPTYNSYESPDLEISLIMVDVMVEQIIDNDKKWDAAAGVDYGCIEEVFDRVATRTRYLPTRQKLKSMPPKNTPN